MVIWFGGRFILTTVSCRTLMVIIVIIGIIIVVIAVARGRIIPAIQLLHKVLEVDGSCCILCQWNREAIRLKERHGMGVQMR